MPVNDELRLQRKKLSADRKAAERLARRDSLARLIAHLRRNVSAGVLNKHATAEASKALMVINPKYCYDDAGFPKLERTNNFSDTAGNTPANLAEALLWKLGRWTAYKKFSSNYHDPNAKAGKQNIVFWAFSRHLRNDDTPIFDQHALRAIWAIGGLRPDEEATCKSFLMDENGKWKPNGTGSAGESSYELFVAKIAELVELGGGVTHRDLDRLLMPLGQAIKDLTETYDEFHAVRDQQ
jgi:hypothetical protein